jgi:hypothetical protein
MRGAFRVESQSKPRQKLKAQKKQVLAKAAVTEVVDKAATVKLQAKVKGPKTAAGSSSGSRVLSQALDSRHSTTSLRPKVRKKIRLRFSKPARKKIMAGIARGGRWKVIVTATATGPYGETSTAKTRFRLVG